MSCDINFKRSKHMPGQVMDKLPKMQEIGSDRFLVGDFPRQRLHGGQQLTYSVVAELSTYNDHVQHHHPQGKFTGQHCPWCLPEIFKLIAPEDLLELGRIEGKQVCQEDDKLPVIHLTPLPPPATVWDTDSQSDGHSTTKKRGRRSKQSLLKCHDRFMKEVLPKVLQNHAINSTHFVIAKPADQFLKRPPSQGHVAAGLTPLPLEPCNLMSYPSRGHFFVSTPWRHFPLATRFIVMRFDKVLDSSVNRQLSNIWDRMKEQGIALSEKRLNQSSSKQCHFGVWEHYSSIPRVTQDSRNQNSTVEATLDEFLALLGKHVIPGISNLLHRYDKQNWERQKIAHQRVLSFDSIQEAFKARPSLDFQGIFFTLAIKDGGSEVLHLDWSDHPWTLCMGDITRRGLGGGRTLLPAAG
ncbi:hypothetical protein K439DRAFT_1624544 [Ramaria rubella]|nr:hypothetical protein K439DRAFT_1624544 [Ramaria rubella]